MSAPGNRGDKQYNRNIAISNDAALADGAVREALRPFGVESTPALAAAIRKYTELLLRWNQKINLTSITEPREILERHFGESMFAAGAVPIESGRLVDVGTGAGFPGLALKLILPELDVELIEASAKKAAFLAEVVRTLELKSVKIISRRVEELTDFSVAVDYVICRAVRMDGDLLAWMRGALREGGKCVLWLGERDAEEIQKVSGWEWRAEVRIPGSEKRVLLMGSPARK